MVERFVAAGLRTNVYDVSSVALDRAVNAGAIACADAAELASASESVSVMVRTDDQMLESVLGQHGALNGLQPASVLLLHSTIHPTTTRQVAAAAVADNVAVADVCIAGVPSVLRAGEAVCLAGGDVDLIERITPLLLVLVERVIHMGPLGCGNAAKIVRNLVNQTDRLLLVEGIQFMKASGVRADAALQMLESIYSNRVRELEQAVHAERVRPEGNLFETILPLAQRLADDLGIEAPLTRVLSRLDGLDKRLSF